MDICLDLKDLNGTATHWVFARIESISQHAYPLVSYPCPGDCSILKSLLLVSASIKMLDTARLPNLGITLLQQPVMVLLYCSG